MYDFAIARMQEAGMRVATVATGGDPSHAPSATGLRKGGLYGTNPECVAMPQAVIGAKVAGPTHALRGAVKVFLRDFRPLRKMVDAGRNPGG